MKSNLHLIMPMGGAGVRFNQEGYKVPKPLIQINGYPFFYWAAMSIIKFVEVKDLTFVVLKEHIEQFSINKEILKYFPQAIIEVLPHILDGPVLTCLAGIKEMNDDLPVLFNDCDHMFRSNQLYEYLTSNRNDIDGGLVTFKSHSPQYSYVKYGDHKQIIGTVEKQVVSEQAICGAYYFRNRKLFQDMSEIYFSNCEYQEYFVSGIYNIMCGQRLKIKTFLCDEHLEFGTPLEYEAAKNSDMFEQFYGGSTL